MRGQRRDGVEQINGSLLGGTQWQMAVAGPVTRLHQEDLAFAHKECGCWWGSESEGEETSTGAPGWGG